MPLAKITILSLIKKAENEWSEIPTPLNKALCEGTIRGLQDMLAGRNKMDEVMKKLKKPDLPELEERELTGYKRAFLFNTRMPSGGRSKLFREETGTITVRLPKSIIKKIPKPQNKTIRDFLLDKYK